MNTKQQGEEVEEKEKKASYKNLGIVILAMILIWIYTTNIKPLMEAKDFCKNRVEYVPAKSSYTENGLFGNPDKEVPAVSEHYTWAGIKFESREKAEKACVANRKNKGQ